MNDSEIIENINKNYNNVKNNHLFLLNIENKKEVIDLSINSNKTLFIENCNNITINITKITQIFIIKSTNIILNYKKPIIGIYITNSNNIKLNETISFINTNIDTDITIELYNSYFINIKTQNKKNIYIIIYCTDININNLSLPLNIFQCCCFMYNDIITYFDE